MVVSRLFYLQIIKRDEFIIKADNNRFRKWKLTPSRGIILDKNNNMSGACTTSGLAYKMKGRIGDSPIIGSGLFIDNKIGGAVATGLGEEVVKTVGSYLVVELMRKGYSPQRACEEAIKRIVSKKNSNYKDFQVAYIAINKKGETGSFSIHKDFSMTEYRNNTNQNYESNYFNN